MAKLYFKYGAMGSSKTAQALITKFNYEERNMKVLLLKPSTDTRDGADIVRSRIGLEAKAVVVPPEEDLYALVRDSYSDCKAVIVDECQFLTPEQVDQLSEVSIDMDIAVLCFGLRTDFLTHFFPGSMRLMELAESITEIKMVCDCGAKATVNARLDDEGRVVFEGEQVVLGGNSRYRAMCRKCWLREKRRALGARAAEVER
ncbi:MAG: thymidine kinase [Firmicutes bacterium]|nr:thymidine kinase [Bacillota bacterium]MBQ2058965.1 thymidine kinase [Bacillota bacterium]MBQ4371848.1 thymidine kinase [Bacillota bacterium]